MGSKSLRLENYSSFPFGIVVELMQQRGKRDPGSPRGAGLRLRGGCSSPRISAAVIPLLIVVKVRSGVFVPARCRVLSPDGSEGD